MKEKTNDKNAVADNGAAPAFKGYTMEELRYQRAMMALRKEFCKTRVLQSVQDLRPKRAPKESSSGLGSKFAFAGQIASKLFSNLNTLDYILMGMSLFGTAKKGYRLLRGKK